MRIRRVRIIGAGLLGTSLGLALKPHDVEVEFVDTNASHMVLAQDLVGTISSQGSPDLIVLAIPASGFSEVIQAEFALSPKAMFIDIASTKNESLAEIEKFPAIALRFCGTHPMAGREMGGPHGARADLFMGRPWILCPTSITEQEVQSAVEELVRRVGSIPVQMSASEHDRAVALISHLPQVISSLLAKQLVEGSQEWLALSGQGLRDTTRIAGSDPELWKGIITDNKEQIKPLLQSFRSDLDRVIAGLDDPQVTSKLIAEGGVGRSRIPGKHGGKSREYTYLPIVIEDEAGQLAALFNECARAKVNVEDLTIEHSPGQFTGLITLALSENDAESLSKHLLESGWNVHASRKGQ